MIGSKEELVLWLMQQPEGKTYELKEHKEKRSLNANAYFWVLVGKIAKATHSTNQTIHNALLRDYGQIDIQDGVAQWVVLPETYKLTESDYLLATPNKVKMQSKKGEVQGIVYIRLRGSHTYNTEEMSRLIDGTVMEAKELGIETLTPLQLEEMKQKWGSQ